MTSYASSVRLVLQHASERLHWRTPIFVTIVILVFWVVAAIASPGLGRVATALFFVLGVVTVGSLIGLTAALCTSSAAFLLFNYYVTEPLGVLQIARGRDLLPLLTFTLCALVAGVLAGRLKDRSAAVSLSNRQLASLLKVSQALQSAALINDVVQVVNAGTGLPVGCRIELFLIRNGSFQNMENATAHDPGTRLARGVREAVVNPSRDGPFLAYRLDTGEGFEGALLFESSGSEPLETAFMSALANLTVLAVERASLSEANAESRAQARTEELKTALLSSVSHDFRTPLTAISASASSLIDYHQKLDEAASFRLLRGIVSECERLNRYTSNLLEMSRLESGQALARRQHLDVADTLSAIIQGIRPRAGSRKIQGHLSSDGLIINADAALFELVIINVLDNAITYSEDGTRISVEARPQGDRCAIIISDQGRGIPDDDLERVFERFYRVARAEVSPRGSGLGLAIAKGFVEALGGQISASTPGIDERGTAIMILLPITRANDLP